MAKILLVEDDNNLREIYEARLQAEGYDIVSAKDGEEALVLAKKERPDLIISDVMLPRVSGFEMLDILRNTPELKDVHVIMLTALGQAEDKTRADSLGADFYMVKSQVTLEDIVKAAADILAGTPTGTAAIAAAADGAQASAPAPVADTTQAPAPTPLPVATPPLPEPTAAPVPPVTPPAEPAAPLGTPAPIPAAPPDTATATTQAPALTDAPIPPATTPSAAPVADVSVPQPQGPPPTQDAPAVSIPAADSQLVTDAVNNLVAGTSTQDNSTPQQVTPAPAPPAATPAAPVPDVTTAAPQPQPPLTMEPVLAPPAGAVPPPEPAVPVAPDTPPMQTTDSSTLPANPARKAINPLPAGSTPDQPNLNDLLAKEGHTMEENHTQGYGMPSHMPGNVITPGASGQVGPAPNQNPIDPNSISL